MLFGPLLPRGLVMMAHRPALARMRVVVGLAILAVLFGADWLWKEYQSADLTPANVRLYSLMLFGMLSALQGLSTLMLVSKLIAPAVAGEKAGKTLHYLLATPLHSHEIIFAKAANRLFFYATALVVALPFQLGLCALGGVGWHWFALNYGTILALAIFQAGITMLVSTIARDTRETTTWTGGIFLAWTLAPFIVNRWVARLWPPVTDWIADVNAALFLHCSPLEFLVRVPNYVAGAGGGLADDLLRAIPYLAGYGMLGLILASLLLRPIYRRQADGDGGFRRKRVRKARRRPPIGDEALLWRERHLGRRTRGLALWFARFVGLVILTGLGFATYQFAAPCFGPGNTAAARDHFSVFLRILTTLYTFIAVLMVTSGAAVSITAEREADTWDALVVTPLDGAEILRAKRRGTLWRFLPLWVLPPLLWGVGVICGAVHPLGFGLAAGGLALAVGLASALGVTASLAEKTSPKASNLATGLLILPILLVPVTLALPAAWLPLWPRPSPWMMTTCVPLVVSGLLLSPVEVNSGLNPGSLGWLGMYRTEPSRAEVIAVGVVALTLMAVIRWGIVRWSAAHFDRIAGRPVQVSASDQRPERKGLRDL